MGVLQIHITWPYSKLKAECSNISRSLSYNIFSCLLREMNQMFLKMQMRHQSNQPGKRDWTSPACPGYLKMQRFAFYVQHHTV